VCELFRDTVGFAGAAMVRRLVGLSHVADMNVIEPPEARCVSLSASCHGSQAAQCAEHGWCVHCWCVSGGCDGWVSLRRSMESGITATGS
jgi:hypothetical protein